MVGSDSNNDRDHQTTKMKDDSAHGGNAAMMPARTMSMIMTVSKAITNTAGTAIVMVKRQQRRQQLWKRGENEPEGKNSCLKTKSLMKTCHKEHKKSLSFPTKTNITQILHQELHRIHYKKCRQENRVMNSKNIMH